MLFYNSTLLFSLVLLHDSSHKSNRENQLTTLGKHS